MSSSQTQKLKMCGEQVKVLDNCNHALIVAIIHLWCEILRSTLPESLRLDKIF